MSFPTYPHDQRLAIFETAVTLALIGVVVFCLSVYVISLPVKGMLMLAIPCLYLNGSKSFSAEVFPLIAVPLYGAAVSCVFPAERPDVSTVMERPLFMVLCVLMISVVASKPELWRHHLVGFGILLVSLIGVIGDATGHDMLALLPFQMPDDPHFDQLTSYSGGAARIRGFFPESGVLGAVSLGVAVCLCLGESTRLFKSTMAKFTLALALIIGLTTLGLTLTKSGLVMVAGAIAGFLAVLAISKHPLGRVIAVIGAIGAAAFFVGLLCLPGDLGSYLRSEVGTLVNLQQKSGLSGGTGLATRLECWKLALVSLGSYPLGVGGWGLDRVLSETTYVVPTPEMRLFFDQGMFGLKCALANIIAETGFVGIGLLTYWIWQNFLKPARLLLRSGSFHESLLAGFYVAMASASLLFLFNCELYPTGALLLFFKCYADALAHETPYENCDH
jgi:hypothetical protein